MTARRPRWKRKRWWAASVGLSFVVLGYLSNAVTSPGCERATAQWLEANLAAHATGSPERHASSKPATYRLPWLASVEYNWAVGNIGGERGRRHYLCLFGYALPLWNDIEIQA